jgi:hypothetical protein
MSAHKPIIDLFNTPLVVANANVTDVRVFAPAVDVTTFGDSSTKLVKGKVSTVKIEITCDMVAFSKIAALLTGAKEEQIEVPERPIIEPVERKVRLD